MLDDLKEEKIVNKVGGRFKLSTLIQKRMVALNTGARPLVELRSSDKMAIVIQEILQDKIYLDNSGNAGAFPAMAGNLMGQKMVLITDETKNPVYRWTWYTLAPGKVRQMAEQSTDGQKTWKVTWDSVYLKRK